MIELDHIKVYQLTLKVRGLMHVGNGQTLPKKEYIHDKYNHRVSFVNERKLFDLLIKYKWVNDFESFCMGGCGDLYCFLYGECEFQPQQVQSIIDYSINAGDDLDDDRSLKDIARFMRNGNGEAYVPGSSVKGAIRTALLFQRIAADKTAHTGLKDIPEDAYINTLNLTKDSRNAINSLMRGIQISDSEPIPDSRLTLSLKNDAHTNGYVKSLNLCRECLVPDTEIRLRMTLDQSVLKGAVTAQSILKALNDFEDYYQKNYQSHFTRPGHDHTDLSGTILRMGGGAGFFTKSLAYPYLGTKAGLIWVSGRLADSFKKHGHNNDPVLGISPHIMKYGRHQMALYEFGVCEVSIR